ncbi:hypothetical protein FPQ18DRAFT_256326 [Pyronema domesticum]|uniref:Similar to Putative histone deacetylase complex subunit cti6 acc. no. Q1MTR4 n=1 Tax=Pyronema omphalodes (strain CBS 100304) TaxID=1076935 RepID=U4LK98_PYROM|nr:hypothetical protein FPQ18DRAFT_256326 [Pyronema domesticum]CCX32358.1 Similar to Putative histone deacetylase complex subunit cti6; acc. no. Q1MTR4 [Pyronema omphalodes CBS 100304]
MVSPRRSSRARSTAHQVTASSSSSASSSRNRHTRHRTEEDTHADLDANSQRGHDDEANDSNSNPDEAMEDAGDQEDEITRCICGFQEYQSNDQDDQSDSDGLFIQCDQCKVWQHGFCVGITDQESTPDNYYCEQCKPELHREGQNKAGLKTSIYLPAQDELPKAPAKDLAQKRRTTMNSRDAEYDEVVFQRMLEESKRDVKANPDTSVRNSRGRKRGSSEGSDEPKDSKRSRTTDSPESPSHIAVDSADEKPVATTPSQRKARGTTTRNTVIQQQITSSKRTSARNKGNEKVEPRKDDSEHSDDYAPRKNNRSRNPVEEPAPSPPTVPEPVPDTPQQTSKRAARTNNNNSRRRNGRNVRQSEDPNESGTSMSRVESSTGKHDTPTSVTEKNSKPRLPPPSVSVNEMKKRVTLISDFITRTQVDMANSQQTDIYAYLAWMEEKGTPISKSSTATPRSAGTPPSTLTGTTDSSVPRIQINGGSGNSGTGMMLDKATDILSSSTFDKTSLEIMEKLSAKINRWNQNYADGI